MAMNRRDLLKISGLAVAAGATSAFAGNSKMDAKTCPIMGADALPKASGKRIVIVGGGPSGLTIAKFVKKENPSVEVVMIEKNREFVSGFISNLYAASLVPLDFITHSYTMAASKFGYTYLNATVHNVDKKEKIVMTDAGKVPYDILVLSTGIEYNYKPYCGDNQALANRLKQEYPAAFIPGSETIQLKKKIDNFEGGNFVVTVPGGNYRCLPGPYERACLIAWHIKKNNLKGKVIVLDANPNITIKADGFHAAFKELYSDIIEYMPSTKIKKIDLDKKVITTELEDIKFEDAAFYPGVRGAKLLETIGLAKDGLNPMEATMNDKTYQAVGFDDIFIAGDARSMPFSKSGNTANTEGKIVARLITAKLGSKKGEWASPQTVCYSLVNGDPQEGISVSAYYKFDEAGKSWGFDKVEMNEKRTATAGQADKTWAQGIYRELFGSN
jgi:sulfide dehydrogenase [flavocytochrome c] flavoprotein chain